MVFFLQQLVQGLAIGSIYGLIAIGYVLIYNTWGVLNFAQGDMVMVGAFTVLVTHSILGLPMPLAIPLAILMCVVIGFVIELTAFRPLLNAENQRRLIATIGVGIFLRNLSGPTPSPSPVSLGTRLWTWAGSRSSPRTSGTPWWASCWWRC